MYRVQCKIILGSLVFSNNTEHLFNYEIALIKFHVNFLIGDFLSIELMSESYNRMNPYEQDFIKCAATLGRVFKRSMLENVMVNSIPIHTTKSEYH